MLSEIRSKLLHKRRLPSLQGDTRLLFLTRLIGKLSSDIYFFLFSYLYAVSMTAGAQQALRRTMEIFSNTTRFCLACNMSNKIIEPIQSRCAILRYAKLRDQEILKRLLEICEMEKGSLIVDAAPSIVLISVIRLNTTTMVLLLSSSRRRETCDRLSIISNRHILDSVLYLVTMFSRCATNHTPSLYRLQSGHV